MYISDPYNSLEGKSQYPAVRRKKNQYSNLFGSQNLLLLCCLFPISKGLFQNMWLPYLGWKTVNTNILTSWSQGQDFTANSKTAAHVSLACFSMSPPCQLSLSLHCCQWVCSDHPIYPPGLVWPDKQATPWTGEREIVASVLCYLPARVTHCSCHAWLST